MYPPFLKNGDEIRIVSPSGVIDPVYIDGAKTVLKNWGYRLTEGKYAREKCGRFAGTAEQRLTDLQEALDDPAVKAVLCSRGGYGMMQIINKIDFSTFYKQPKWLIGFSDITVLHSAVNRSDIASLHAVMAKHLTELSGVEKSVAELKSILSGKLPDYKISSHPLNREGKADGVLRGGNLSVLMGLRATGFDFEAENTVLFIEDIGEEPYRVDRMMQSLKIGGALSRLSGLVVGQFSNYNEDESMLRTVEEIIKDAVIEYTYPVCFNFPAGHTDENYPLVLNGKVCFEVAENTVSLSFCS